MLLPNYLMLSGHLRPNGINQKNVLDLQSLEGLGLFFKRVMLSYIFRTNSGPKFWK